MQKTSIQRRLIAAVILSQLLLAVGLVWMAVYLNHRLLRRNFDTALQGRAMSIAALARYSEEPHPQLIFDRDMAPPPLEHGRPDLYQIVGSDGRIIAQSPQWATELDALHRQHGGYVEFIFDNVPYRGVQLERVPVFDREPDLPKGEVLTVSYASPTDDMQRQILLSGIYTAAGCAVLLSISVALAVWGLRRGLRPLSDLAAGAARVSPANWELHASEVALNTTELVPLTQAMTVMLGGLRRAFDQQREFVANAAHELKTPVAILKSTMQSLLQRPRVAEDYRAGLEQALDDLDRLEKMMHLMLRLARAEQWSSGSPRAELEIVDVTATCQSAVDFLEPLLQERGVNVEVKKNGLLPMRAKADDLRLVWSHSRKRRTIQPPGGRVRLRMRGDGQYGLVEVEDDGPGIPPAELSRIFERLYRGDSPAHVKPAATGTWTRNSKALRRGLWSSITAESFPGHGTRMGSGRSLSFIIFGVTRRISPKPVHAVQRVMRDGCECARPNAPVVRI